MDSVYISQGCHDRAPIKWYSTTSMKPPTTCQPLNAAAPSSPTASRRPVNVAAWAALDAIVYVLQEGLGDRLTGYSSLPNERPSGAPVHSITLTVTSDDVQVRHDAAPPPACISVG